MIGGDDGDWGYIANTMTSAQVAAIMDTQSAPVGGDIPLFATKGYIDTQLATVLTTADANTTFQTKAATTTALALLETTAHAAATYSTPSTVASSIAAGATLVNLTRWDATLPYNYAILGYNANSYTPVWTGWTTPAAGTAGGDTGGSPVVWTNFTVTNVGLPYNYSVATGAVTNTSSATSRIYSIHAYLYAPTAVSGEPYDMWIQHSGGTAQGRVAYAGSFGTTDGYIGCAVSATIEMKLNDSIQVWARSNNTAGTTLRGGRLRISVLR